MSAAGGRSAGYVYVELIGAQLAEERAAKTSLEQRAASTVTWAGGLVAASLALASTLPKNPVAGIAVVVAAALLVIAAYLGTRVITPRADYEEADLKKLREVISDATLMEADELKGLHRVGEQALDILEAARKTNSSKAEQLRWALRSLAAGAGSLAVAVGAVVYAIFCTPPG